jgi:hypothetical protein
MSASLHQSKSFSGGNRYLPGLTMPTGHTPSDLINPDDKDVENAYIEVCRSCRKQGLWHLLAILGVGLHTSLMQ